MAPPRKVPPNSSLADFGELPSGLSLRVEDSRAVVGHWLSEFTTPCIVIGS